MQWVSSFGSGSMWEHFQKLNYCNLKMAGNTGLFSCQFSSRINFVSMGKFLSEVWKVVDNP